MTKITFIGAGSLGFTRDLVRDILTFPLLTRRDNLPDGYRPRTARFRSQSFQKIIDMGGYPAKVGATLDRVEALKGADVVLVTILMGGPRSGGTTSKSPRNTAWISTSATRAAQPAFSAPCAPSR